MLVTEREARAILNKAYPDIKIRLTPKCTIGVKPIGMQSLAWAKVCKGRNSLVRIGVLQTDLTIDWSAEVQS